MSAPSSNVEAVARELERMAEHATFSDHEKSPIVDTIARAPSARPFIGALRVLVGKLTAGRQAAPPDSIVVRLLRTCDLDVAVKLDLLREFLLCERRSLWGKYERANLARELAQERDTLAGAVFETLRDAEPASFHVLFDWLDDRRRLAGIKMFISDIAMTLLHAFARADTRAVLEAANAHNSMPAYGIISQIAGFQPEVGMAFARRCAREGPSFSAAMALSALAGDESMQEDVCDLAIVIASDPGAGHARPFALSAILDLPSIPPSVWPIFSTLPDIDWQTVVGTLALRIDDGFVEPLEVLEQRMRRDPIPEWILDDICHSLSWCFVDRRPSDVGSVPLSHALQKRILEDVAEAWRRGASGSAVGRAVEAALYERSDAEYASLGLDDLALALAATDAPSRKVLMYAVTSAQSGDFAWSTRLLDRVAEVADVEERTRYVDALMGPGTGRSDRWAVVASERLLAAGAA